MASANPRSPQPHAARPIDVGAHVFTLDGARLGKVCEVHPEYFKLVVSLKPDYWLSRDTVWSSDLSGVHVNFRRKELASFVIRDPAPRESAARVQPRMEQLRGHHQA